MTEHREMQELLAAFRAGEPAAAAEFYALCEPVIRAVVRRYLHHRLRARFDSLDFVQDVWASFLTLPPDGQEFASAEGVRTFLARVAHNKVVEVFRRRFGTQKDDLARGIAVCRRGRRGTARPAPRPASGRSRARSGSASSSVSIFLGADQRRGQVPAGRRWRGGLRLREVLRPVDLGGRAGPTARPPVGAHAALPRRRTRPGARRAGGPRRR